MISCVLKEVAESTPQTCARGPLPRKRRSTKSGNSTIVKRIRQSTRTDNVTDQDNSLVEKEMTQPTKVSQSAISHIFSKKLERFMIKKELLKFNVDVSERTISRVLKEGADSTPQKCSPAHILLICSLVAEL